MTREEYNAWVAANIPETMPDQPLTLRERALMEVGEFDAKAYVLHKVLLRYRHNNDRTTKDHEGD